MYILKLSNKSNCMPISKSKKLNWIKYFLNNKIFFPLKNMLKLQSVFIKNEGK